MKNIKNIKTLGIAIAIIVFINLLGQWAYQRFDLTQDKRYTLSEAAKNTIATTNSPIYVDVFLQGNLPPEFKRLQAETE